MHRSIVLDDLSGGAASNIDSFKPEFIEGSILDRDVLGKAVADASLCFTWRRWDRCRTASSGRWNITKPMRPDR